MVWGGGAHCGLLQIPFPYVPYDPYVSYVPNDPYVSYVPYVNNVPYVPYVPYVVNNDLLET